MDIKLELKEPVIKYMLKFLLEVPLTITVSDAVKEMKKNGVAAAVVTDRGKPVGIVTERDVLYKLVAPGKDASTTSVSEIMSSPVETIGHTANTGEAVAKMSRLGIRRLAVMRDGQIIGLVVQKSIISGTLNEQVPLPELTRPKEFRCPYCDEVLRTPEELSKHIDQLHIGAGLLQGDVRKW